MAPSTPHTLITVSNETVTPTVTPKSLHQPQAGPSLITAAKLARGGLFATLYGDADLYGLSTLGVTEHEAIDFSSDGDGYATGWPANDTAVSVLATDFSVRYDSIPNPPWRQH